MKYLLYLFCLALVEADPVKPQDCKGQAVTTLSKETLKTGLYRPREFTIDHALNTIYFTHGKNERLAKINLDTKEFTNIESVKSRSQSVNQKNHEVFIATNSGIHKYDPKANEIEYVGAKNTHIASVYYDNNALYFIDNITHNVFKIADGKKVKLETLKKEKLDHLVIDSDGTIFFTYVDLRSLGKDGNTVVYNGSKGLNYRALATDSKGQISVCTDTGMFRINKAEHTLENVLTHESKSCSGLTFDKENNVIYSDGRSVFKIKAKTKCIHFDI